MHLDILNKKSNGARAAPAPSNGTGRCSDKGSVGLRRRIAADNDTHLPIRQVLLLIVNTLLGASGLHAPLTSWGDAKSLVREGRQDASRSPRRKEGCDLQQKSAAVLRHRAVNFSTSVDSPVHILI
jgi:hypothetical protein